MEPSPTGFDSSVHGMTAADRTQRDLNEADIGREIRESASFKRAVIDLRCLAILGGICNDGSQKPPFRAQQSGEARLDSIFVPATVDDIEEHLQRSEPAVHPSLQSAQLQAPASLVAAVHQVTAWDSKTADKRAAKWKKVDEIQKSLIRLSARLRQQYSPLHIKDAPGPALHIAWLACIAEAFDLDDRIAVAAALGLIPTGDIPSSGAYPEQEAKHGQCPPQARQRVQEATNFDDMDHVSWNNSLAASVVERGAAALSNGADPIAEETVRAVHAATATECDKGTMNGPFSMEQMDAAFGQGHWRGLRRFGVWQKGKCHPCDEESESLHNYWTVMHERLECDGANFPAVVAALFSEAGAPLGKEEWQLLGGTDDIEAAYRRAMCAMPQFTVVCVYNPKTGEAEFLTLYGLNFGLSSSPLSFNRFPRLITQLMRRVLAVPLTNFYDDFCTIDPALANGSGQKYLWAAMESTGMPLAEKKHVPMAPVFIFLGVQADFSALRSKRVVYLGVTQERTDSIADAVDLALDSDQLTAGAASHLAG